jgi:hypothetical protein
MLSNNTLAVTLGISPDNAPYLFLARTKPGDAEIHEQMDDVAIIRSGHDVLKTGHQVFGKIATEDKAPWRNWFCEGIKKPEERTIGPGDFVIIPAMTVHQYVLGPGDTLSYWTIKVKQVPNPGSN